MTPFQDVFLDQRISTGYDSLLLGNTVEDKLGFKHYADLFYGFGLQGREHATLLDLGCGPGHVGLELAGRLHSSHIHFLDFSPSMIEKARHHSTALNKNNGEVILSFTIDDAARLEQHIPNGSIDLVIARHLLQIVQDPETIIRQAYNVLKEGGKFIFTMVGYNTFNFSDSGNSLFENPFYSRLTHAFFEVFSKAMIARPSEFQDIRTVFPEGVRKKDLLPKYDKQKVFSIMKNAGIPLQDVCYLILPEYHTVQFKKNYSIVLGSIPLPGVRDIFPLIDRLYRVELVNRIYEHAFPNQAYVPVLTHDPVFVVTKR